jgi:hypothetical protein
MTFEWFVAAVIVAVWVFCLLPDGIRLAMPAGLFVIILFVWMFSGPRFHW